MPNLHSSSAPTWSHRSLIYNAGLVCLWTLCQLLHCRQNIVTYHHINSSLMSLLPYFFTYTKYVWLRNVTMTSFCHVLRKCTVLAATNCIMRTFLCVHRNAATCCKTFVAVVYFILLQRIGTTLQQMLQWILQHLFYFTRLDGFITTNVKLVNKKSAMDMRERGQTYW